MDEWVIGGTDALLSVIVPVHNVGPWLDELLYSILEQDVPRMEVLAVNDHSIDESRAILDAYAEADPRLAIIEATERGGATARNIGVLNATGKYIVFADGDDIVPAGAYRALVESLESSGSDIAFGDYLKFNATKTWRPTENWDVHHKRVQGARFDDYPALIRGRACWNKVFRRDFWVREGVEFPEVKRSNDIKPMVQSYMAAKSVDIVPVVSYLYRQRPGTTAMSAKADPGAALESYLQQELACATMIDDHGNDELRRHFTNLFAAADGWVHLRDYALGLDEDAPGLSEAAREALAGVLERLDEHRLQRIHHDRVIPQLLWARGADSQARTLVALSQPGVPDSFMHIGPWLDALETLATDPEEHHVASRKVWEDEIAPRFVGETAIPSTEESVQLVTRLHRAIVEGIGSLRFSKASSVERMTATLTSLSEQDLDRWLYARTVEHVVADTVTRTASGIQLSGPLPSILQGHSLSLGLYRRAGRLGKSTSLQLNPSESGPRWSATVRGRGLPEMLSAVVRLEFYAETPVVAAIPVVYGEGVKVPPTPRTATLGVYRNEDNQVELLNRGWVAKRLASMGAQKVRGK